MLLSAVLACALLIPVTAEEAHASDQPRIVKVGYTDSEGLLAKNDDGTYEGYTYDYLMRVAQFTGWSFEFVEAEGDNANERALRLLEMLDNGEVDIRPYLGDEAALLAAIEAEGRKMGITNLISIITDENAASCRFHEKNGFVKEGHLHDIAVKFGRRCGVCYYRKELG